MDAFELSYGPLAQLANGSDVVSDQEVGDATIKPQILHAEIIVLYHDDFPSYEL